MEPIMRPFHVTFAVAVTACVTLMSFQIAHAGATALPPMAQAPAQELPDGPGKAVVTRVCTACHGTDFIVQFERTVPVWKETLEVMKSYGAEASDEDWKTISSYIMANVARLSVNKATADEIGLVFVVNETIAQGVVAYRDKQGGFKTIDDLKKAPDVDAARIDALAPRLMFETN